MPLADNPNFYANQIGKLAQAQMPGRSYLAVDCEGEARNLPPTEAEIAAKVQRQAMQRAWELVEIAQQLENIRTRLTACGLPTHVETLDKVVVSLVQQWTMERPS